MNEIIALGALSVLHIGCVGVLGIGHVLAWGEARQRYHRARAELLAHRELAYVL